MEQKRTELIRIHQICIQIKLEWTEINRFNGDKYRQKVIDLPSGNLTQLLKMDIEIVSFPIKNGDVPQLCGCLPEGIVICVLLIPMNPPQLEELIPEWRDSTPRRPWKLVLGSERLGASEFVESPQKKQF